MAVFRNIESTTKLLSLRQSYTMLIICEKWVSKLFLTDNMRLNYFVWKGCYENLLNIMVSDAFLVVFWGGLFSVHLHVCVCVCLWFSLCVCVSAHVCVYLCVLSSEYGSWKTIFRSPFSASATDPKDWTQVVDLHFHHLKHLACLRLIFCNKYCYMEIFEELFTKVL